ncbi:MAG TPA: hypothetical protein VE860_11950 [Chthoniobacterales bacterium]|jgi:hypothetical protein|nr:hypothetical protein [Chthoniobacterales bacterium]
MHRRLGSNTGLREDTIQEIRENPDYRDRARDGQRIWRPQSHNVNIRDFITVRPTTSFHELGTQCLGTDVARQTITINYELESDTEA